MDKILIELNRQTGNKYSYLRVNEAVISAKDNLLKIVFLIPYTIYDNSFSAQDKDLIKNAILTLVPASFKVEITYKKTCSEAQLISGNVVDYFRKFKPTILSTMSREDCEVNVNRDLVQVVIHLEPSMRNLVADGKMQSELKSYLEHFVCDEIVIKIVYKENDTVIDLSNTVFDEFVSNISLVPIKLGDKLIGGDIKSKPLSIASLCENEDNQTICGKILSFNRSISKKSGKVYYKMDISDKSGTISVLSFSKNEKDTNVSLLQPEREIVCFGNVSKDSYNNKLSFMARGISYCEIDYSYLDKKHKYRSLPKTYMRVKPEPYVDVVQNDLFSINNDGAPQSLIGKSYVIFDFETTGLDPRQEEIMDIGAVRIVDGVIVDTFQTLVNPRKPIPPEVTALTHITDEMVETAPTISDVIGDFLLYINDSEIVAYNVAFDYQFLSKAASTNNYELARPYSCAMELSKKKVKTASYKLINVCKAVDIQLIDAHRALSDALATAKLFIKLADMPYLDAHK